MNSQTKVYVGQQRNGGRNEDIRNIFMAEHGMNGSESKERGTWLHVPNKSQAVLHSTR